MNGTHDTLLVSVLRQLRQDATCRTFVALLDQVLGVEQAA